MHKWIMFRWMAERKSESWMGSHFTNDDLLKQSSWYRDYETTLKWVDRDGKRQLEMTSIPKPDAPVVYTRIVQWLDGASWIPIQADYFDGKTVIRTMHFRDIKDFQGRNALAVHNSALHPTRPKAGMHPANLDFPPPQLEFPPP